MGRRTPCQDQLCTPCPPQHQQPTQLRHTACQPSQMMRLCPLQQHPATSSSPSTPRRRRKKSTVRRRQRWRSRRLLQRRNSAAAESRLPREGGQRLRPKQVYITLAHAVQSFAPPHANDGKDHTELPKLVPQLFLDGRALIGKDHSLHSLFCMLLHKHHGNSCTLKSWEKMQK